jgi:alpha,alpha-trehalase
MDSVSKADMMEPTLAPAQLRLKQTLPMSRAEPHHRHDHRHVRLQMTASRTGFQASCRSVICALWISLVPIASSWPLEPGTPTLPPQILFPGLFEQVQEAHIYADGKAFVDAVPKDPPDDILAQYHVQKPTTPQALKEFVAAHFTLPAEVTAAPAASDRVSIVAHIDGLWDVLTRSSTTAPPYSSLLTLPQPYVVPGGRFRELYYWDSYFTMLGLADSGRGDLIVSMVKDFAYLIDTYGHVPNGTRTYYLSRSQPPFFFAMVGLTSPQDPPAGYAAYLDSMRREYAFWMDGEKGLAKGAAHRRVVAMPDGSVLNRFWDDQDTPRDESYREDLELARSSKHPAAQLFRDIRAGAESGWDYSSRWFVDGRTFATIDTTEIVPVDLNSLLYGMESAIRAGCERRGEAQCAREFEQRAAARRRSLDRYLWDSQQGVYLDYRWRASRRVPDLSAAAFYPLFVSMASARQAGSVAKVAARRLLKAGGIVTTPVNTGQQWDSPNGWAPLQWIAVSGLRDYGNAPLAAAIACRWIAIVNDVYAQSGKLVEKYDVVAIGHGGGGEYPLQDGFGWTNGVMRRLLKLYPDYVDFTAPDRCPSPGGAARATDPVVKKLH